MYVFCANVFQYCQCMYYLQKEFNHFGLEVSKHFGLEVTSHFGRGVLAKFGPKKSGNNN